MNEEGCTSEDEPMEDSEEEEQVGLTEDEFYDGLTKALAKGIVLVSLAPSGASMADLESCI